MDKISSQNAFLTKAKSIHGDKYILDETDINKQDEKHRIEVICREHGKFKINIYNFLNGQGCSKCSAIQGGLKHRINKEECLQRCIKAHGDLYRYDLSNYSTSHSKLKYYCEEHGWQEQQAVKHWAGQGCKYCSKKCYDTDSFINESKKIFGDSFDYSLVEYKAAKEDVLLKCNKCGKTFPVTPNSHLTKHTGCSFCNISHLEQEIYNALITHNINFVWQFSNNKLERLHLDFYLLDYKIGIECQGRQHFRPYIFFGGEEAFTKTRERDIRKKNICKEQNIELLYFSHEKEKTFLDEFIFASEKELIRYILTKEKWQSEDVNLKTETTSAQQKSKPL